MTDYLTIPGGRGLIRADTIESACVHVPRLPFTDEITGQLCACVLMIETRRCLHRFNFAVIDEARAVVQAAGVLLSADAGGHAKRDQESADTAAGAGGHPKPQAESGHPKRDESDVPLPPLPSSRREPVGPVTIALLRDAVATTERLANPEAVQ